ncbi:MAG: hypothetical protein R2854_26390 [Caldilineaceae bacterium]
MNANMAPTVLTLETAPAEAAYGTAIAVTARLTSDGAPVANALVTLTLDGQSRRGPPTATAACARVGRARAARATTLRVSFAGNSGYAPSRAETPFRITTQATALQLEVQPVDGGAPVVRACSRRRRDARWARRR